MVREINTAIGAQRPESKAIKQTILTSTPQHQQQGMEEV